MRVPKRRNVLGVILIVVSIVAMGLLIAQDQKTLRVRSPLAAEDLQYPDYLARLLGHRLTSGDAVIVHTNGDAAFPAMLAAIQAARHRVSFESYIFDKGDIPTRFVDVFAGAASRGVAVRLVLDSIGAKNMDRSQIARLQQAGVKIAWFNPLASYSFEEANYRTHRKALVIDGDIAFVGGIGIADHWAQGTSDSPRWRDTHVELRGPVALDVEAAFNENWIETGGIVAPDLLPHDAPAQGHARSVTVWSSPAGGTNAMKLLYLLAMGSARRTLDIQSPYFITDESTEWSLLDARRRGVRIRILVEGDITDARPVKFASRALYQKLLDAGVEIFEYQPSMMHTKVLLVDDVLSMAGSANFDNRSLELNDELNVVMFEPAVTARLRSDFEHDIGRSKRLTPAEWRARPLRVKAKEYVWSFFGELF